MEKPKRNKIYTVAEIGNLSIRDSACLVIDIPTVEGVDSDCSIQTSDLDASRLEASLGHLEFRYFRETNEWIPVFHCASQVEEVLKCVSIEIYLEEHYRPTDRIGLYAYPKPNKDLGIEKQEQFYKLTPCKTMFTHCYQENGPKRLHDNIIQAIKSLDEWKKQHGYE